MHSAAEELQRQREILAYPFLARKAWRLASALSRSTAGSCTKWSYKEAMEQVRKLSSTVQKPGEERILLGTVNSWFITSVPVGLVSGTLNTTPGTKPA